VLNNNKEAEIAATTTTITNAGYYSQHHDDDKFDQKIDLATRKYIIVLFGQEFLIVTTITIYFY
jgi:hypothetical protein